jgi:oligopeptidase B
MRKTFQRFLILLLAGTVVSCAKLSQQEKLPNVKAPVAKVSPYEIVSKSGDKRTDNYYWLKNREDTAVINYLKAENNYRDTMMASVHAFQDSLFEELRSRVKEDDSSVPYKLDNYYYYTRFIEGGEYPIYCRKKDSLDGKEEILADGNAMGKNQSFLNFFLSTSPDHKLAAIVMDTVGRNFYTIKIKRLADGKFLGDKIANTRGGVVWTNDNKSIYYSVPDQKTLRNYQIKRHVLSSASDPVVYEEKDQTLACYLSKTRSKKYVVIGSGRTDASFSQYIDADKPGKPVVIQAMQENVQYDVDHMGGDKFYIYTNLDAKNYRLIETPISKSTKENWKDVIPVRDNVFLRGVEYFKDYLIAEEMTAGLVKIRVIKWADKSEHYIDFGEPAYFAGIGFNPEMNSTTLRYVYQSMTTPNSTIDYTIETREKRLMKEQPVLGGFDKNNYQTERVMVKARDGKEVPLSIVYRKDAYKKDGTMPGWINAYGSYGSSTYATFSSNRISLLDRGFVYAIAHVRGGQEMGGAWYDDGKMMKKKNTFYDFIDCSEWLVQNKYVAKDKLFASGGSAGGLLMGAITNMRPDLYRGVIAAVPFVDVITTMMDESIPLTTFEWLEWGNPAIKEQYDYMLSYSPYDNIEKKEYPNLLVTTGLHDSQVQYWEPAKWVAKLRAMKTDRNRLYLYTNMDAGHGGASGRFRAMKDVAMQYTFVMDILGMKKIIKTKPQIEKM